MILIIHKFFLSSKILKYKMMKHEKFGEKVSTFFSVSLRGYPIEKDVPIKILDYLKRSIFSKNINILCGSDTALLISFESS